MPDGVIRPSLPRQLLTAAQVAMRLNRTVTWFYRNRPQLEAMHGFPRPVDGCGMRWDPAALDAWLDSRLPRSAVDPMAAAEQRLIQRAKGVGRRVVA